MPKNILQDVTPPRKRSIRDIPIKKEGVNKKLNQIESEPIKTKLMENEPKKPKSFNKSILVFVVLLLLVGVFIFSAIFSGAKVILVPKEERVDIVTNLSAVKDDIKTNKQGVPFKIVTITEEGSKVTYNMEEKNVDKKASGEIIIFNDYNSSPQKLIINTRFKTSDGLIYKIPKSVVVPGRTSSDGKTTPGSVTVTVYADSPGGDYNIGLVDFTIPGFKGTDRYSKFYARSKTTIAGGYSGVMKIVPSAELEKNREEIKIDLTQKLKSEIYSQIPEGFILYEDGIFINFENASNIDLGDSVQIVERGILNAILFDKIQLSNYVAKNIISDIGDGAMEIFNLEDLEFGIVNKYNLDILNILDFNFSLKGEAHFVWSFNNEEIKKSFAGQSKKNINQILSEYKGIKEAEVTLSPFWKRSFPDDLDKIEVERKFNLD